MTYTAYQPIDKQVESTSQNFNLIGQEKYLLNSINISTSITISPELSLEKLRSAFLLTNKKTTSSYKRQPIDLITSSLRREYSLDIDKSIPDLLQEQPHLILVLLELLPITVNCFKGDSLHLTIIKDPENSILDKFAIVVNTHLHSDRAFIKLQELDDLCFQARIPNDILVHVEFSQL